MKTYLGVKIVQAVPEEKNGQAGYKVLYPDGYVSWCPKNQFEEANREIHGMSFGHAVEAMKKGNRVARSGWNGKGMYLFLIGTDMSKIGIGGWTYTNGVNDNYPILPFIAMKTATGEVVPWLASQTDILSDDWAVTLGI